MSKRARKEINLEAMVKEGEAQAYEALQLYRSRSNRAKQKGDFAVAVANASQGSKILLQNSYENAGSELGYYMVDLMNESAMELTPDVRAMVNDVDSAFISTSHAHSKFLKACIKWSIDHGPRVYGDPMIQCQYASCLWDEITDASDSAISAVSSVGKSLGAKTEANTPASRRRKAIQHFAAGEAPQKLWQKLEKIEDTAEREKLLTLGVLHFLALENIRDANELFASYSYFIKKPTNSPAETSVATNSKKKSKASKAAAKTSELDQFLTYLLQVTTRDAAPLFKQLCGSYGELLNSLQEPEVSMLLAGPIATKLFNIAPQPGMLSMLSGMFGGGM